MLNRLACDCPSCRLRTLREFERLTAGVFPPGFAEAVTVEEATTIGGIVEKLAPYTCKEIVNPT